MSEPRKKPSFWDDPFYRLAVQRVNANLSEGERRRLRDDRLDVIIAEKYGRPPAKEGELPF